MTIEIKKLASFFFKPLDLKVSNVIPDPESEKYAGFNFKINETCIKFRKSKATPKKEGQFVTFWKRDPEGKTVPFETSDDFDFYLISIEENSNSGFFIFPKTILEKENYISGKLKPGKRGFRIYADWHLPKNKQAVKTKLWQTPYFINFSDKESTNLKKFEKIFNSKNP